MALILSLVMLAVSIGIVTMDSDDAEASDARPYYDVLLYLGQSNIAYNETTADKDLIGDVKDNMYYYGNATRPAISPSTAACDIRPIADVGGNAAIGGLEGALAHYLTVPNDVLIVNGALPGTSITTHQIGGTTHAWAKKVFDAATSQIDANQYKIRINVVWLQGEADSLMDEGLYYDHFVKLTSDMRNGDYLGEAVEGIYVIKPRFTYAVNSSPALMSACMDFDDIIFVTDIPDNFSTTNGLMSSDTAHYSQAGHLAIAQQLAFRLQSNIGDGSCFGWVEADWAYSISNGKATITGYTGPGGDVVVPREIGGYPVIKVESGAVRGNLDIKTLVIGDNIREIGDDAFRDLTNLKSLVIEGDPYCGSYTFWAARNMSFVELTGITELGPAMLGSAFRLFHIELPSTVVAIGPGAFNTSAVYRISLPDGLQSIGWLAFLNDDRLWHVDVPPYAVVDAQAFQGCTGLLTATAHYTQSGAFAALDADVTYYAVLMMGAAVHRVDVGTLADPTLAGSGTWYTDAGLTEEYDWTAMVTEDVTLYAATPIAPIDDGGDSKDWTVVAALAIVAFMVTFIATLRRSMPIGVVSAILWVATLFLHCLTMGYL